MLQTSQGEEGSGLACEVVCSNQMCLLVSASPSFASGLGASSSPVLELHWVSFPSPLQNQVSILPLGPAEGSEVIYKELVLEWMERKWGTEWGARRPGCADCGAGSLSPWFLSVPRMYSQGFPHLSKYVVCHPSRTSCFCFTCAASDTLKNQEPGPGEVQALVQMRKGVPRGPREVASNHSFPSWCSFAYSKSVKGS